MGPGDDSHFGYRSKDEINAWIKKDELKRIESMLASEDVNSIQSLVERDVSEAFEYAENSPFPKEEDLLIDAFA